MDNKMPNIQYVSQHIAKINGSSVDALDSYLLSLITENKPHNPDQRQSSCLRNLSEEAARYHILCGGKRIRAKIGLKAASALGLSEQNGLAIAAISELLHNASLVHDDLQDGDETRRDSEAVWFKYGKNIAICTGDLLLSAAYAALAHISNPKLIPLMLNVIHVQTSAAIRGQGYDVNNEIQAITTLHDYQQVAIAKSGALLCLPIQLALVASKKSQFLDKAKQAAEAFAISYQIADDLNDIQNDARKGDKPSALNIAFVLKSAGHKQDIISYAMQIALQKTNECIAISEQLPHQSGAYLGELALKLKSTLLN